MTAKQKEIPSTVLQDRWVGVLVGLAAGDALGSGYELGEPPVGEARMIGGGLGGWDPGEWTDDTQMALCIAEEAAEGRPDLLAVATRFLDWYRSGPPDVGNQIRAVLSASRRPEELADAAARYFERHPDSAAGNGSLMRTAPVALAFVNDVEEGRDARIAEVARTISSLTHADPLAGDACVLWCIAIDRALREGRLDGIDDGLTEIPPERRGHWAAWIAEAREQPYASFSGNGFVVRALQAALAAIVQTERPEGPERGLHLREALQAAVSIGGDTDTVAAIAGALLGARYGSTAVPPEWQLALHGWPGYDAWDLSRLALRSTSGGRQSGWPEVDSMVEDYEEEIGRTLRPLAVECPGDPGVVLANLTGAREVQQDRRRRAEAVISLCRVGRRELEAEEWLQVRLIDSGDPAQNPNLDLLLRDLAREVARLRSEGKRVVLHCVQAHSRTPTVAAAFLAERDGVSGHEAWRQVVDAIGEVYRNPVLHAALGRLWPEGAR